MFPSPVSDFEVRGEHLAHQEPDLLHVECVGAAQVVSQASRSGNHHMWLSRQLQCLSHHVWSGGER